MKTYMLSLTAIVSLLLAGAVIAADAGKTPPACDQATGCAHRCPHCGCACQKYCKTVCEMKEVKKTVWVVKCEDICIPNPSCGRGGCGSCDSDKACNETGTNGCDKKIVPPKCGKIRTIKKLIKTEVVCKEPSYKCVVEYGCPNCDTTGECSK
jgi:hypothetical protein